MSSADRIMIAGMVSNSAAAIYSLATTINAIALLFWNAINSSLMPLTFDKLNSNEKNIAPNINILMVGYGVICVGISLMAPEILRILGPEEYQAGIYIIPPVACVAFLSAMYNLYSNIEFYYKASKRIATATISAAIVNVMLNYLLIPRFGFIAAAYTTLISNGLLVIMHYIGYKNIVNVSIYNDLFLGKVLLVCVTMCLLCNSLYGNRVLRYGVIVSLLMLIYIKRKYVFKFIESMHKKL